MLKKYKAKIFKTKTPFFKKLNNQAFQKIS